MKRFFRYLRPLWEGNDNRISLRSGAAIALCIDFLINVHNSASVAIQTLNLILRKDVNPALISAVSTNLAQVAMILGIEAALIAALLGLKTYQNTIIGNTPPPPFPVYPEPTQEEGA